MMRTAILVVICLAFASSASAAPFSNSITNANKHATKNAARAFVVNGSSSSKVDIRGGGAKAAAAPKFALVQKWLLFSAFMIGIVHGATLIVLPWETYQKITAPFLDGVEELAHPVKSLYAMSAMGWGAGKLTGALSGADVARTFCKINLIPMVISVILFAQNGAPVPVSIFQVLTLAVYTYFAYFDK